MKHEAIPIQAEGSKEQAVLYTYLLDHSAEMAAGRTRPLVLICPGGGYHKTSDREAEPLAMRFLAHGCHAAVLRYSVAPARYPEALLQLALAVSYLRGHAKQFHIDPDGIIVQGSSAGGHLAASLGVFWQRPFLAARIHAAPEDIRPNGLMLSYPVITSGEFAHRGSFLQLLGADADDPQRLRQQSLELQVSASVPRTFLWHTQTDDTVPVENSLLFYQALHRAGVSAELHIYPVGGHGLSLANEETANLEGYGVQKECQSWISLACGWLSNFETTRCGHDNQ